MKADALKVAALKETVLVFVKPTPPDALGNLDQNSSVKQHHFMTIAGID